MNTPTDPKQYTWLKVILSHLLAGVTGMIGLFYWFTYRQLVNIIMVNSTVSIWSWKFIDLVTFILYGIIWLLGVLVGQYFYEKELKKRKVPRIFIYVTAAQIILFVGSYLVIRAMVS